jgi:hypothetical protein
MEKKKKNAQQYGEQQTPPMTADFEFGRKRD